LALARLLNHGRVEGVAADLGLVNDRVHREDGRLDLGLHLPALDDHQRAEHDVPVSGGEMYIINEFKEMTP